MMSAQVTAWRKEAQKTLSLKEMHLKEEDPRCAP